MMQALLKSLQAMQNLYIDEPSLEEEKQIKGSETGKYEMLRHSYIRKIRMKSRIHLRFNQIEKKVHLCIFKWEKINHNGCP